MYNFLNSVVEPRGQRLQWLGFSDCMGTERKSSAFVSVQPVYKSCRWLHHWNESLGNILASGRTGEEERQCLLPPPLLTPLFLPLFLLKTCSLWILKTKAEGLHWAFQNTSLFAFMSYKKVPFSKISLAEDQAIVYGCEKTLH